MKPGCIKSRCHSSISFIGGGLGQSLNSLVSFNGQLPSLDLWRASDLLLFVNLAFHVEEWNGHSRLCSH